MLSTNQARDLGDGLRRLRIRKQVTRYRAAEICAIPHLVYARLERGQMPAADADTTMMRAWSALQMYRAARGA
jgi:hypothetical protein